MKKIDTWNTIQKDIKALKAMNILYFRWFEESKYEDWSNYEEIISKLFPDLVKATKQPFGAIVQCDDGKLHIYLRQGLHKSWFEAKDIHGILSYRGE